MTARRFRFDIRQAARPVLVLLGVLLLANAAAFIFLVRPKLAEVRALQQATDPQVLAVNEREREVERLESFLGGLRQAETDLATLRSDVLSTRDRRMVEVQRELARLCRTFKIDLDSVTYDNESLGEEQLDRFAMVLPLEGGYANLRRFLQAVEDSDKFLVVEQVALGEGKEGGAMLQLNITLATYFDLPAERPAERARRT